MLLKVGGPELQVPHIIKVIDFYGLNKDYPFTYKVWEWMLKAAETDAVLPQMTAGLRLFVSVALASGQDELELWEEMRSDQKLCGWRHLVWFLAERNRKTISPHGPPRDLTPSGPGLRS